MSAVNKRSEAAEAVGSIAVRGCRILTSAPRARARAE